MRKILSPLVEFEYTVGGVGHTKKSLENLIKCSAGFLVRIGNIEEKVKILERAREMVKSENYTVEDIIKETGYPLNRVLKMKNK